jgi:DNA processing protein
MTGAPEDDDRSTAAHAAALAGLDRMTPVRLAKILDGFSPATAWAALCAGTHPADTRRLFTRTARATDVTEVGERYARAGVAVLTPGGQRYPSALVGDPGAPAVLFAVGDPAVLEGRRRVAIVGTRSATPYGCRVASELAADLAAEDVVVVSGLALGIDGAAHAGVVCRRTDAGRVSDARPATDAVAPPVAVVGTGLDRPYPSSNAELWSRVSQTGSILSEAPLGSPPRPGAFPARNRIIAALADVVVVVECHRNGGSMYTADAAARRSIPVCAVPGSVHSRASDGTNALLVDGCTPVRDAADVLTAVALARAGVEGPVRGRRAGRTLSGEPAVRSDGAASRQSAAGPSDPRLSVRQLAVWRAVEDTPTTFESILLRSDLSVAEAAEACGQLVEMELLVDGAGWWSRR